MTSKDILTFEMCEERYKFKLIILGEVEVMTVETGWRMNPIVQLWLEVFPFTFWSKM